jgi:hemoglobin
MVQASQDAWRLSNPAIHTLETGERRQSDTITRDEGGSMSVFETLGGEASVAKAVERFYAKLTSDPESAPFFEGADVMELQTRQRMFLTATLGGPDAYEGRDMRAAHAHLHLTDADFDHFLDCLAETLSELGFEAARIAEVLGALSPLRLEIVSAPPADSDAWGLADPPGGRG